MISEHSINKNNNFIAAWYINDNECCENLIDYFENHPNKIQGKVGSKGDIRKNEKDSTDLFVTDLNNTVVINYLKNLSEVINKYQEKYIYSSKGQTKWSLNRTKSFNIQRYLPNQGFHAWHTERHNVNTSLRHLTFMTYLNDVNEGGETEFYYQNLKIKPEKGLTVIWGTDWTFTHRGIPSKTETKYITTGHFYYD